MIDWITAEVPIPHPPINGGHICMITREGEIEKEIERFALVEGSFSNKVSLRTIAYYNAPDVDDFVHPYPTGYGKVLRISGNPVKWFQGHNIWGTDDLQALLVAWVKAVFGQLGYHVSVPMDVDARITRVDVTENFRLPSTAHALAWIRSASTVIRGRRQGVSVRGSTLYIGQGSRRVMSKFYVKEPELRKHKLPDAYSPALKEKMMEFSKGLLRIEFQLKSMELDKLGLSLSSSWTPDTAPALFQKRLSMLNLPANVELPSDDIEALPARLRAAYHLWKTGVDLDGYWSRATFYRYRKALLEYNIDIEKKPRDTTTERVVALWSYLEAKPDHAPGWSRGTPLYYSPPRLVAV